MSYGIIYKISNTVNNKVYIGQTRYSLEYRFNGHKKKAMQDKDSYTHLQLAMRKYGIDVFKIEQIDTAESQDELNEKEKYWINYYNSIVTGYNMMDGGTETNPMDSEVVKKKHYEKVHSEETRNKISKSMHELRSTVGFSEETRKKLSEAAQNQIYFYKNNKVTHTNKNNKNRISELLSNGWVQYDEHHKKPKNIKPKVKTTKLKVEETKDIVLNNLGRLNCFATRSVKCYCIVNNTEKYSFESILEAGIWWYENYKPFGDIYSDATFQRKIKASIEGKEITYGNKNRSTYKHITNIKWYKGE